MPTDAWKDFGVRLIACFSILWTPFFFFSSYRGHPIPAVSLAYSALLFLLVACLAAGLAGRGRGVRRVAVFTLLIVYFLDVQVAHFDGVIGYAGAFAVAALAWLIRTNLAVIAAVMFSTILVSSFITDPGEDYVERSTTTSDAPGDGTPATSGRLIHLVLDEFIGPSGIPVDIEGGPALRADLERFFRSHDFVLEPDAISEYAATRNSVSGILNFEAGAEPQDRVRGKRPYVLRRNAYFERLHELGHSIHVHQSTYLDVCRESPVPLASCLTYRYDGTDWLRTSSFDPSQKLAVMLGLYLNLPGFFESVWKGYVGLRTTARRFGIHLPVLMAWDGSLAPITPIAIFDSLREEVASSPEGAAHFAHLILPHGPYVYDADCNMRPHPFDWLGHHPLHEKDNSPSGREVRYPQYFAQVRCTMGVLDAFFDDLKALGKWADTEIVLHGDHGSRIYERAPRSRNREQLTHQDLSDAFSTLFAIRSPRYAKRVGTGPRPISVMLGEFAGAEVEPPLGDAPPIVYLEKDDDEPWIPIPYTVGASSDPH